MATVDHLPFPVEPKSNTPCRSRDNRIVGWAPATEDAVEATCGPPRGLSSRGLASEISTPEELGASGKLETGTSGPETSGTAFGGECDGSIVIGSQLSTVSWVGDSGVLASELTTDGSLLCQSPILPTGVLTPITSVVIRGRITNWDRFTFDLGDVLALFSQFPQLLLPLYFLTSSFIWGVPERLIATHTRKVTARSRSPFATPARKQGNGDQDTKYSV